MTYTLPPLNALRAFEGAARHLSFKLAAHELHVTPAAVGQQVKALEARPWWKNATDLPDASFFDSAVQSLPKKYFCFSEVKSPLYSCHPVPLKGAYHDRRETRGGVRWTRVALLTRALSCGRRSRVVLTPRRWCQVGGSNSAGDGGQKARAPGSARIIRKPLRGECRVIPV